MAITLAAAALLTELLMLSLALWFHILVLLFVLAFRTMQ